jgi:preprotein translocase subunit SecE
VARNRKRAKERRTRGETRAAVRPRLSAAPDDAAPDPIEHAAPDVELADAQLAIGRPELGVGEDLSAEAESEELEEELEDGAGGYGEPPSRGAALTTGGDGDARGAGAGSAALAEPRAGLLTRLIGFLQGSWRELQRVQWPDRRQVAQATGVVIGFVIVAGVFLGVADLVASKLMNFILK